ncbi:hypothetical protein D3C72_2514770 [compost metagenome]
MGQDTVLRRDAPRIHDFLRGFQQRFGRLWVIRHWINPNNRVPNTVTQRFVQGSFHTIQ